MVLCLLHVGCARHQDAGRAEHVELLDVEGHQGEHVELLAVEGHRERVALVYAGGPCWFMR
jgi:hypothetical protein